jgi:hypothetical protein
MASQIFALWTPPDQVASMQLAAWCKRIDAAPEAVS